MDSPVVVEINKRRVHAVAKYPSLTSSPLPVVGAELVSIRLFIVLDPKDRNNTVPRELVENTVAFLYFSLCHSYEPVEHKATVFEVHSQQVASGIDHIAEDDDTHSLRRLG